MQVIIASKNPVKINATEAGFKSIFPNDNIEFNGISVDSEISDQPMTDEETLQGALNRIKNSKIKFPNSDYYCGIEGGIEILNGDYYAFAWIVIDNGELVSKAKTASFCLPKKIKELIDSGMELGHANDLVFNKSNSKQKQGAVGILTKGNIDRTSYYQQAVIMALIPFINQSLY